MPKKKAELKKRQQVEPKQSTPAKKLATDDTDATLAVLKKRVTRSVLQKDTTVVAEPKPVPASVTPAAPAAKSTSSSASRRPAKKGRLSKKRTPTPEPQPEPEPVQEPEQSSAEDEQSASLSDNASSSDESGSEHSESDFDRSSKRSAKQKGRRLPREASDAEIAALGSAVEALGPLIAKHLPARSAVDVSSTRDYKRQKLVPIHFEVSVTAESPLLGFFAEEIASNPDAEKYHRYIAHDSYIMNRFAKKHLQQEAASVLTVTGM